MHRPGHQRDARATGGSYVREHVGGAGCGDQLDRSPKGAVGAGGALAFGGETSGATGQGIDRSWEDRGGVRDLEVGGMEGC